MTAFAAIKFARGLLRIYDLQLFTKIQQYNRFHSTHNADSLNFRLYEANGMILFAELSLEIAL